MVEERANKAAGNHLTFKDFAWQHPDDEENWYLFYTSNRDSHLIDVSNEKVWREELKPFIELEDVWGIRHSHWAVGHVDGFAVRVFYANGEITDAFRKVCEIQDRIDNYPVLDEADLNEREYHATQENIENAGRQYANYHDIELPEDWLDKLHEYIWKNDLVESDYDGGWWPSDEVLQEAFKALNWDCYCEECERGK